MSSTAAQTATGYQRTFGGRADQLSQVRRDIAGYLGDCPVTGDMVLIADELAANAILFSTPTPAAAPSASAASYPPGQPVSRSRTWADRGGTARPMTAPTGWTSSRPSPDRADGEPGPPAPEAASPGHGCHGELTGTTRHPPGTTRLPSVDR